jgi:hypothetical protein
MSEQMDMDEYNRRAIPRLARLDAISDRCNFGVWEFECTPEQQRYREEWNRLMCEQNADEYAAGL